MNYLNKAYQQINNSITAYENRCEREYERREKQAELWSEMLEEVESRQDDALSDLKMGDWESIPKYIAALRELARDIEISYVKGE